MILACSTCRYIKTEDKFKLLENNKLSKSCLDCIDRKKKHRESLKCSHKLNKRLCEICDGSHLCIHKRYKFHCVCCVGTGICEHSKRRERCRLCNGNQICQHDKVIDHCKICNFKGWLRRVVTGRMHKVLGYSDFDYLCCDIDEFIEHIENQFEEDMNWCNHGTVWSLDHKLALKAKGITVDETINRLCYLNVRPLYIKDNLIKYNKDEL